MTSTMTKSATKTLLAVAAAVVIFSNLSHAATPAGEDFGIKAQQQVNDPMEAKRKKPRVPGGSGCNSARDIREHAECRRPA